MRRILLVAALIGIVGLMVAGLQAANSAPGPSALGPIQRNITYCMVNAVQLKMDLYYPQTASGKSVPVAVYVHGGGWMAGDKADGAGVTDIAELTARGYLVAAINYRLAPQYKFPAQIEDVKCAIRSLRANAAIYHLDPNHIGAWGGSAGGHLVSLLGVTDTSTGWDVGQYMDQSSRVQAVVDMFGPADLTVPDSNGLHTQLLQQVFGTADTQSETLKRASPVSWITSDDPPFLILQGEKDTVVPPSQSQEFYDKLQAGGVPATLVMVQNAGHGFVPTGGPISPSRSELTKMIADFFDQHLPSAGLSVATPSAATPLVLSSIGEARALPNQVLGASAEGLVEHLLDNPAKIAAIKATAPAILRFPGGSQSNYYDWRTGLLPYLNPQPNSSTYYRYWVQLAAQIARAFPNGIHYEQYAPFAAQIGAETILVPNLETASVADQVAWFKQLASEKILPQDIELGNEFWIAMGGDPNVLRKWPNEPTSMAVMQQYERALSPIVGPDAKFAVQASGASFNYAVNDPRPFIQRLIQWDAALAPADWFQAVTAHLYTDIAAITAAAGNPTSQQLFSLLMGRSDQGVDRVLDYIAQQLPGKEIWVTEWSPRGGGFTDLSHPEREKVTPPMNAQLVARTELALLRHPEVTKALYFELYAENGNELQAYVQSGSQFVPMAPTVVLGWFDDAANGGSTFQRVVDANGQTSSGLGSFNESYRPIEGGLFRLGQRIILILQNASTEARLFDPTPENNARPTRVELLVSSDFNNNAHLPAQVTQLDPNAPIILPPFSIVRVIWE